MIHFAVGPFGRVDGEMLDFNNQANIIAFPFAFPSLGMGVSGKSIFARGHRKSKSVATMAVKLFQNKILRQTIIFYQRIDLQEWFSTTVSGGKCENHFCFITISDRICLTRFG